MSYERLAFALADSSTYRSFCRVGYEQKPPTKSALQKNVKRVSVEPKGSSSAMNTQSFTSSPSFTSICCGRCGAKADTGGTATIPSLAVSRQPCVEDTLVSTSTLGAECDWGWNRTTPTEDSQYALLFAVEHRLYLH